MNRSHQRYEIIYKNLSKDFKRFFSRIIFQDFRRRKSLPLGAKISAIKEFLDAIRGKISLETADYDDLILVLYVLMFPKDPSKPKIVNNSHSKEIRDIIRRMLLNFSMASLDEFFAQSCCKEIFKFYFKEVFTNQTELSKVPDHLRYPYAEAFYYIFNNYFSSSKAA